MATASIIGLTAAATASEIDGTSIFSLIATAFTSATGGWTAFGMLTLGIVVGAAFEWWVPGRRHRRVEEAAAQQSKVLADTVTLLGQQSMANEITKDFFLKTVPKRGEATE